MSPKLLSRYEILTSPWELPSALCQSAWLLNPQRQLLIFSCHRVALPVLKFPINGIISQVLLVLRSTHFGANISVGFFPLLMLSIPTMWHISPGIPTVCVPSSSFFITTYYAIVIVHLDCFHLLLSQGASVLLLAFPMLINTQSDLLEVKSLLFGPQIFQLNVVHRWDPHQRVLMAGDMRKPWTWEIG